MSKMTLLELKLRNFKGVKQFALKTNGSNIRVFGDNATGKTTIFDAFVWLLFDKDSQNKKDFQIKTLTIEGQPIHNLEHEVEGTFDLDGKEIKLRKVYVEKWTKKRGNAKQEFAGHTTDYYIDDVPSKKKEFNDLVSSIVDEGIFKLLTSPSFFNEQLHWQDRRKTLLEICGEIADSEVISSDKKLAKLTEILSQRSVEDHKKVILAKRKEINQELDRIPVRIDEVQRSIPDISNLNKSVIETKIDQFQLVLEGKEAELSRIQNGGEVSEKQKRLREIEGELLEIKNQLNAETHSKVSVKQKELYEIQNHIDTLKLYVNQNERNIRFNEKSINDKEETAQLLRTEWSVINASTFNFDDHQTSCPSCGQDLPQDQIEEARSKAEAHFNLDKSQRLESIQNQGKSEMTAANELKVKNEEYLAQIENWKKDISDYETKLSEAQKVINSLNSTVVSVETNEGYQTKKRESEKVQQDIQSIKESVQEAISKVREEIMDIKSQISSLNQDMAKFTQVEQANKRIEELTKQEQKLAAEFERLEEELYLIDEFTRAKVNLMEEKINSKFKYARFKLFEEQINGSLNETCVTTFNGVPYDSGLNNAARINVGLDIINTLSEHYGFSAPIFIDNSEAVTKFIDLNSQVVSLVVSESDKKLRVENQNFPEAI